jgi:hypothetical protein
MSLTERLSTIAAGFIVIFTAWVTAFVADDYVLDTEGISATGTLV